jgi:ABC-type bacteriocin/lantibiotic exporter with double-glycine peptidase domain
VGRLVIAVGLLLAAVLRLVLPARRAGLLVVRSRRLDVALLLVLGAALLALASSVPEP